MNYLDDQTIADLAMKFMIVTTDDPKQTIIDQLGLNILNHSRFVREIVRWGHANDWQSYLSLTKHFAK